MKEKKLSANIFGPDKMLITSAAYIQMYETGNFLSKQFFETVLLDSTLHVIMHNVPDFIATQRFQ